MDSLTGAAIASAVAWASIVVAAVVKVPQPLLARLRIVGAASMAALGLAILGLPVPGWVPASILVAGAAVALATRPKPAAPALIQPAVPRSVSAGEDGADRLDAVRVAAGLQEMPGAVHDVDRRGALEPGGEPLGLGDGHEPVMAADDDVHVASDPGRVADRVQLGALEHQGRPNQDEPAQRPPRREAARHPAAEGIPHHGWVLTHLGGDGVEHRLCVVGFPQAHCEDALAAPDAAEIEAHNAEARLCQADRQVMHQARAHRSAKLRMRMQDQHGHATGGAMDAGIEATYRACEEPRCQRLVGRRGSIIGLAACWRMGTTRIHPWAGATLAIQQAPNACMAPRDAALANAGRGQHS